jgi:hypothetical protein
MSHAEGLFLRNPSALAIIVLLLEHLLDHCKSGFEYLSRIFFSLFFLPDRSESICTGEMVTSFTS